MSAHRIRVHTASGAVYLIDNVALTWKRTHDDGIEIIGMPGVGDGKLVLPPVVEVGERMFLDIMDDGIPNYIRTTRVESAEVLD